MKCGQVQNKLELYARGKLTGAEKQSFDAHLKTCDACRGELALLRVLESESGNWERQMPPEHLWSKITDELDAPPAGWWERAGNTLRAKIDALRSALPAPQLQLAAFLAVVVVAILIGKKFAPTSETGDELVWLNDIESAELRVVGERTQNYVEKSKILLLGIVNAEPATAEQTDWTSERALAQSLAEEAVYLREKMPQRRNQRVAQLVEELELILLEIANLESQEDFENIELIQDGIDRKGLLLKIQMHDLREHPFDIPQRNQL